VILAFALLDRKIVDAGDAQAHQAAFVEFPILVAIAAEPMAAVVVPFIGKAHGDAIFGGRGRACSMRLRPCGPFARLSRR